MEKEKVEKQKLGFFKKIALAITDFRFYPLILKTESSAKSFGHFFLFLMILTLVISIKMTDFAFTKFNYFLEKYDCFVIPFAVDSGSGTYLYTTSGIYYVDANNSEMFFVAKNIENFLESLTEEWNDGWY